MGRPHFARFAQWQGREPASVAADTTYGNGEFLQWLLEREITPYMRTRDSVHRKKSPFYGPEHFTYLPESNSYRCPAGSHSTTAVATRGTEPSVYRDPQTLWCVLAKNAMHQRSIPVS